MAASGGEAKTLTDALDRPVNGTTWSADSRTLAFSVVDDRARYAASVPVAGGRVLPLTEGKRVVEGLSAGADGNFAVLSSTATELPEVYALESGRLRKLTSHNDGWLGGLLLGTTENFTSVSRDKTEVHGLIVKPPTFTTGRRYPTLLRIHGGPNGQDEHAFSFDREFFAAHGYVVLAINYRGSAGRGAAHQKASRSSW